MEPLLAELDLNPVLVGASGPIAVDCVMVLKDRRGTNLPG
jgi:acetyltransferase